MRNKYVVEGDITKIYINSRTTGNHVTIIDTEDLGKVKKANSWAIKENHDGNFYVKGVVEGEYLHLHRYILGTIDPKIYVDHIHRDTLYNRKSMLREVTPSENRQNSKVRTDNRSGHTGINWHKASGKWYVRIMSEGKRISLGCYENLEDAITVRKEAENRHFKYLTSLPKKGCE